MMASCYLSIGILRSSNHSSCLHVFAVLLYFSDAITWRGLKLWLFRRHLTAFSSECSYTSPTLLHFQKREKWTESPSSSCQHPRHKIPHHSMKMAVMVDVKWWMIKVRKRGDMNANLIDLNESIQGSIVQHLYRIESNRIESNNVHCWPFVSLSDFSWPW